ncbi:MAG: tyrosine-type recombinase/integrase [Polyangiaceae bacterium]|nr:tyrosine-type recombinase/integrase [Polyangiaceae bacterium]
MTTKTSIKTKGAGSVQWKNGHRHVRVSLPDGTRPWYRLCGARCSCAEMSEARAAETAAAVSERERERVAAELGETAKLRGPRTTIRDFGEAWTKGELHRKWPDHIRAKRSASDDAERLELYVYPVVGTLAVADFRLDDAERVMARLPRELASSTRRHVAQVMHRLMAMAVYPARLREANPLPKGFMPKVMRTKAFSFLYPEEDVKLLKCRPTADKPGVELVERLFFGFLAREGMREGEALTVEWTDLDLTRGVVRLDVNKSDDARAWALGDDVLRALTRWHALSGAPTSGRVFRHLDGRKLYPRALAGRLRAALATAGVTRAELFERSKSRQPLRVHDLRATFVTLALATGKSETWVSDRTGHKSSVMIHRYKRSARTAAELGLGWLAPLDAAIPELAELANVRRLAR